MLCTDTGPSGSRVAATGEGGACLLCPSWSSGPQDGNFSHSCDPCPGFCVPPWPSQSSIHEVIGSDQNQ